MSEISKEQLIHNLKVILANDKLNQNFTDDEKQQIKKIIENYELNKTVKGLNLIKNSLFSSTN